MYTWILILIINGHALTTAGFNNQEACLQAKKAAIEAYQSMTAVCVRNY